jgi:hypothetical protein
LLIARAIKRPFGDMAKAVTPPDFYPYVPPTNLAFSMINASKYEASIDCNSSYPAIIVMQLLGSSTSALSSITAISCFFSATF